MNKKWKKFERLVAAINKALASGAEVEWNALIQGRQFDVVMRFTVGAYKYLTVIECRDSINSVPVGDVEAFITKSKDVGADKSVMVASKDFQSGALAVAERHNIQLFSLSYVDEIPPDLLFDEFHPALQIYNISFQHRQTQKWMALPEDKNLPPYLAKHLKVTSQGKVNTLDQIVTSFQSQLMGWVTSQPQVFTTDFPEDAIAYFPHEREHYPVSKTRFSYQISSFRKIKIPGLDPFLLYKRSYNYADAQTGEATIIPQQKVSLGFDTRLEQGKFYFSPNLEFSYYCAGIKDGIAQLALVESYQHAQLVQAEIFQSVEYSQSYVEITDAEEITRLRKVGEEYLSKYKWDVNAL